MGLANGLTVARLLAVPALLLLFLVPGPEGEAARLAVFAAAAATDWLDGWVARRRGETSRLGAALDPAADKMLTLGSLLLLVGTGSAAAWLLPAVAAILLREILVSGLREALGAEGAPLATARLAKWKTAFQMLAIALLLAGSLAAGVHAWLPGIGGVLLWAAAALAVWSGVGYAREAWRRLAPP